MKAKRSSVTGTKLMSFDVGFSLALQIRKQKNECICAGKCTLITILITFFKLSKWSHFISDILCVFLEFICTSLKYAQWQLAISCTPAKEATAKMRKYRSWSECFSAGDAFLSTGAASSFLKLGEDINSNYLMANYLTWHRFCLI